MENSRLHHEDDVTRMKIDVKTAMEGVPDIGTLDIVSRLSPQPQDQQPRINGSHQVNGVCESPERTPEAKSLTSQPANVETSHLNQLGKKMGLFFQLQNNQKTKKSCSFHKIFIDSWKILKLQKMEIKKFLNAFLEAIFFFMEIANSCLIFIVFG